MKMIWPPAPYSAGIAITDDPDNGTFANFKTIYDLLSDLKLPTTRAMWIYDAMEPTGTPSLPIKFFSSLLTEKRCLDYCKKLHSEGFEFCLHGASSGNNKREYTIAALDYLEREIGASETFICHSKNAENIYWEDKCIPLSILKPLVRMYSKNSCYGEIEHSPYFWGDVCRNRIEYIRLFRTRMVNTLAFNPNMPYHIFEMPYVNFWFSATKGYLPNLINPEQLDALCLSNGAGIFYQYLHKYIDDKGTIKPDVIQGLKCLSSDKRIMVRSASEILNRLKQFKLLFPVRYNDTTFIINASRKAIHSVQLTYGHDKNDMPCKNNDVFSTGSRIVIPSVEALSACRMNQSKVYRADSGTIRMHGKVAELKFPLGTVLCNLSDSTADIDSRYTFRSRLHGVKKLDPFKAQVFYSNTDAERLEILNPISKNELYRIFTGQTLILLREHLFLGRKLKAAKYLKEPGKVEDQSNW
ncbi:MAG: hypothetical protein JW915_11190 [Chitinispirillaceae bacterium]|nr:hypothetical protein [Chitinispirillaceae bacterium]